MSEIPTDETPETAQPDLMRATTSHVISGEKFDAVPKKRAVYIALYLSAFLLWLYVAIGSMILVAENTPEIESGEVETATGESEPALATPPEPVDWESTLPPYTRQIRVLLIACIFVFYFPFVSVLRTMGYPWPAVIAFCGFVVLPIPGLFVVAYFDTRIAKVWNAAALMRQEAQDNAG